MESYIAIPRAIVDIYWNGLPKESEALGVFCVEPEFQKNMFGKLSLAGFKETITEKKIVNRVSQATIDNTIKYEDVDCMIKDRAQIGDLTWEIIDNSCAEVLLPPEELEKYMSMTPEEVDEQLQSIRRKAKTIGQEYKNLESNGRFLKPNINSSELYVAIPRAIVDISCDGFIEKSEALGIFCVKPEIKKSMFGKLTVAGFKETITENKIVNRVSHANEFDAIEYEDIDCMVEDRAQIGDLVWEVVDKSSADRLLLPEELEKYMSMTPEEVNEQLQSIRTKAKTVGQTSENISKK